MPDLRLFVFALFFIFGGITSLNDVVIPKLKGLFTLSYAEVMLVQSPFSWPTSSSRCRRRRSCALGYMRTAVVGLIAMTAGCLLFVPASRSGLFVMFLAALFVLAAGITIVQVVANPSDLDARAAGDRAQPADVRAGVQFARHHDVPVRRLDPDTGLAGQGRYLAAVAGGTERVPDPETHVIVATYLGWPAR